MSGVLIFTDNNIVILKLDQLQISQIIIQSFRQQYLTDFYQMKFLQNLKTLPSLTVKDIQKDIFSNNRVKTRENESVTNYENRFSQYKRKKFNDNDMKITTAFYQRICQKLNCKCQYHQRNVSKTKNHQKKQNNQSTKISAHQPAIIITIKKDQKENIQEEEEELQFLSWKKSLLPQELKQIYFQYLRTLPQHVRFKRHQQLDCFNSEFEQFLKNNYLVILDRKKRFHVEDTMFRKSSNKIISKMQTEASEHINRLRDDNHFKSHKNQDYFTECNVTKQKKLGFTFNDDTQKNKSHKRKKLNRSSFFGGVELDVNNIFLETCQKFINRDEEEYEQGIYNIRAIAAIDLKTYESKMEEIQSQFAKGLLFKGISKKQSVLMGKMVLEKILNEIEKNKNTDKNYHSKQSLIKNIIQKYGYTSGELKIPLQEFWKVKRGNKSSYESRRSFRELNKENRYQKRSGFKDEKDTNKRSSKAKIKDKDGQKAYSSYKRTGEKRRDEEYSSSESSIGSQNREIKIGGGKQDFRFKYIGKINHKKNEKSLVKGGGKRIKRKEKRYSRQINPIQAARLKGKRKATFQQQPIQQDTQFTTEILKYVETFQIEKNTNKNEKNRYSSTIFEHKNLIMKHIEVNKKFLKRIQHKLVEDNCEKFVIHLNDSIITKKRKIRAIQQAITSKTLSQKDPFRSDILKYISIYTEYCNLVTKSRKYIPDKSTEKGDTEDAFNSLQFEVGCLFDFLQDLKKQRQLKYYDIRLLTKNQDAQEPLILKIPQYTTFQQRFNTKKIKPEPTSENYQKIYGDLELPVKKDDDLLQRELGYVVKESQIPISQLCQNNHENDRSNYMEQFHQIFKNKKDNFQHRLKKYHQSLKMYFR